VHPQPPPRRLEMSQTHAVALPTRSRLHLLAPLALVVLLLALVTLALVQDGGDQVADTSPAAPTGHIRYGDFNPLTGRPHSAPLPQASQPQLSSARPDESAVAAAIGAGVTPEVARPDESNVAAAIGAGVTPEVARPDESRIAAAISGGYDGAPDVARPDEGKVAAAVGAGYAAEGPTPFSGQR
jgi:hypothetical protein